MYFIWCALVFSRDFRRQQRAKSKYIFESEEGKRLEIWSLACPEVCPLVQAFEGAGPAGVLALVLWSCVPSFCPLSRFVLGVLLANMALFRVLRVFLARFVGFVCVCVVCGLCVACGALYACGVRRIKGLLRVCLYFSSS